MSTAHARRPLHQSWVWLLLASYLLFMGLLTTAVPIAEPVEQVRGRLAGIIVSAAAVLLAVVAGRGDSAERRGAFWFIMFVAALLFFVEFVAIVRFADRGPRSVPRFVMDDAQAERIRRLHAFHQQLEQEAAPPAREGSEPCM